MSTATSDTADLGALEMLAQDHAARRWVLARRVGYLEGVINSTLTALDAGADGDVVAKVLREMLDNAP